MPVCAELPETGKRINPQMNKQTQRERAFYSPFKIFLKSDFKASSWFKDILVGSYIPDLSVQ